MSSYGYYFKAAVTSQINIVVFAGLVLLSLVSWNPIPLIAGLAGEFVWLGVAPLTPAFQRYADKRSKKYKEIDRQEDIRKKLASLPSSEKQRFNALSSLVTTTREQYSGYKNASKSLLHNMSDQLDDMMLRYLNMLSVSATYDSYLKQVNSEELTEKIDKLKVEIDDVDERVKEIKLRQKNILEKRYEKLLKAKEDTRLLHAQLEAFEDLVRLMKEQALTLKDTSEITDAIDSLMSEIEITEQTVEELESSFAEIFDRELREAEQKKLLS